MREVARPGHPSETVAWAAIGLIATATTGLMATAGLSFEWTSALRPGLPCVALVGGALFYRTRRPDERIAATLVAVAQIIAFSAVAATFSYAVAAHGGPLWDARLAAWDRALGLDWRGYFDAVAARPTLALVTNVAYASLIPQIILAACVLGLTGRFAACRAFVLAVVLAGAATIVVSGLMPANTAFVHLGLHPQDFPSLDVSGAYGPVAPFRGLREGTLRLVSLRGAEGLITFPSFHAALGLVFIRAFWTVPWARWPTVLLDGLLIAATPVNGGHYFVDVAAGLVVAVLAVVAAGRIARLSPRPTGEIADVAVATTA